jgi:hypothetical protein
LPFPTALLADAGSLALDVARRLEISGRSSMTKDELVQAIEKENDRRTARSRHTS